MVIFLGKQKDNIVRKITPKIFTFTAVAFPAASTPTHHAENHRTEMVGLYVYLQSHTVCIFKQISAGSFFES